MSERKAGADGGEGKTPGKTRTQAKGPSTRRTRSGKAPPRAPKATTSAASAPEKKVKAPSFSPRQVVVLGMHRSGTSALTGALSRMGLFVGEPEVLTASSWENPEGFFERQDARQICDALLHGSGADWWKVSGFDPDEADFQAVARQRPAIRDMVKSLDESGRSWALKEPRLCLLMPIFRSMLRRPFAIITVRHPMEVARSLRRRNGFPIRAGLALWEAYTLGALRYGREIDHHIITYESLLADPVGCLAQLAGRLADSGVDPDSLNAEAAASGIDGGLRREYAGGSSSFDELSADQLALYEAIEAGAPFDRPARLSVQSVKVLKEFEQAEAARLAAANDLKQTKSKLEERTAQKVAADGDLQEARQQVEELKRQIAVQNKDTERKLGDARSAAEVAKARLETIETERARAVQQLGETKAQLDERSAQRVATEETLQQARQHTVAIEEQAASRVREFEAELAALRSELERSTIELKSAKSELAEAEVERELSGAKFIQLDAALVEANDQLVQRADAETALREENAELDARVVGLTRDIAALEERIENQAGELGQVLDMRDRLADELNAVKSAASDRDQRHKTELESLEREVESSRSALSARDAELDAEKVRAEEDRRRHGAEVSEQQAKAAELERALADKEVELRRLTQSLDEARNEVACGEVKQDALWGALAEKTASLEAQAKELTTQLRQDVKALKLEITEKAAALTTTSGERSSFLAEAKALKGQLVESRAKVESLEATVNADASRRKRFEEALEAKSSELARVRQDVKALKLEVTEKQALQREAEALRKELAALRSSRAMAPARLMARLRSLMFGASKADLIASRRAALAECVLFDAEWYLRVNPDIAQTGMDPLDHYLNTGDAEGRDPHPLFRRAWYLSANAIATLPTGVTALENYLSSPRGRSPHPLFDPVWYAAQDGASASGSELVDYLTHGWQAGRQPNEVFDPVWYLRAYPDVKRAGIEPLCHYIGTGVREGRDPGPDFASAAYRETYQDVRLSGVEPLEHYVVTGMKEGRGAGLRHGKSSYLNR